MTENPLQTIVGSVGSDLDIVVNPSTVVGGGNANGTVSFPADSGGVDVQLSSSRPENNASEPNLARIPGKVGQGVTVYLSSDNPSVRVPTSIFIDTSGVHPDVVGWRWRGSFQIQTSLVAVDTTVKISASVDQGSSVSTTLTVNPPLNRIPWEGKNWYLLGVNYPWWNYGTDFGTGGWGKYTNWNDIITDFTKMPNQGVHIARWHVFADGRYSPDFNGDGMVAGLDNEVLQNIDQALQIAAKNHIYLLVTIIDSAMWNSPSNENGVQKGGHKAIVTNPIVQVSFFNNALNPLIQHIAASPYKNYVIGYDIVNEPELNMDGYGNGVGLQKADVQSFVKQCATYIHQYHIGAYATLGSAKPQWVSIWKGLGLDFYQFHYYPWMDGEGASGSGLPTFASLNLDKPCIVGEFPTTDISYGWNDTTPLSAKWYLDTIYNYGYAGVLPWSYRPDHPDVSNWPGFHPVFTQWAQLYASVVGPQSTGTSSF